MKHYLSFALAACLILPVTAAILIPGPAAAQGDLKSGDLKSSAKQGVLSAIGGGKAAAEPSDSSFSMPVAIFVMAKASGFGMYDVRPNATFKQGEQLRFYVEPKGYKYRSAGDLNAFGVAMGLELQSPGGETLFKKDDFLDQNFVSHHDNHELMLNGDLDITGAPPGSYILVLTLRDNIGGTHATAKLPFTIQ